MLRRGALREACAVATGGSWREIYRGEAVAGGCGWARGWRLCSVVVGPAVVAWLAVVGGGAGGIATIGLRHAGDTPWRGVYGSKTPCWCGLAAVLEPSLTPGGRRARRESVR